LKAEGIPIDTFEPDTGTVLLEGIRQKKYKVVLVALENGADPNQKMDTRHERWADVTPEGVLYHLYHWNENYENQVVQKITAALLLFGMVLTKEAYATEFKYAQSILHSQETEAGWYKDDPATLAELGCEKNIREAREMVANFEKLFGELQQLQKCLNWNQLKCLRNQFAQFFEEHCRLRESIGVVIADYYGIHREFLDHMFPTDTEK
jgi:hypothetical protein